MYTVTVTIGRNVGAQPMSDAQWLAFKVFTRLAVEESIEGIEGLEAHEGIGSWHGMVEGSFKVTALCEVRPAELDTLRAELVSLAQLNGQDAIALSVGLSELVEAPAIDPDPRREHGLAPRESVSYGR